MLSLPAGRASHHVTYFLNRPTYKARINSMSLDKVKNIGDKLGESDLLWTILPWQERKEINGIVMNFLTGPFLTYIHFFSYSALVTCS